MGEPEKEEASQQAKEDAPPVPASGGVLPSASVLCLGGAALFSLTTWLVVVFVPTNKEMEAVLDAQVPEEVWSWTMVAFLTALFMNIMTLIFQLGTIRGPTLILACYINTLAAVSHFLYWKKISPTVEDVWGHPFEIEREVMWLFATPMMVLNLSTISDFSVRQVQKVMIADVGMILFGLAFRLVPHKETSAFCFIGSMACFGYVLPNLWNMFNAPLNCSSQTATSARALRFIRMYTMVFWNTFWVVELLLWFDILPIGLSAYMLAGLDIGGKVVFSSSLVLGNMDTMDQRRRNAMQIVEEANKVQVINELKEVIEYKNHFLSSTSHELRTPLNGIIGLSEAILSGCCGEIPPNVIKIISTVKSSGNRLLNLVNDILDSASMQKGKLVIKHEKVQLATLAEDVVDLCAPLVKKAVVLSSGITTHMPPVRGDHGRIIQILYNLVGNSCKFTHSGNITISARQEGGMVFVSVSDSGVGIPTSKFSNVFEKFEQVDIGTTRKYGGTGLGLSLVKDLVEAHDGQISVASEMGVGTCFTFTLPVFDEATHGHHNEEHHSKDDAPAEDNTHPEVLEREPSTQQCNRHLPPVRTELHSILEVTQTTPVSKPNCSMSSVSTARKVPYKKTLNEATGQLHVLSVDDDPVNQLVVKNLMSTRSEMKVTQAMNGEDALKACKDAEYLPDVILLDVMMPGMNGYEVCQTFRESYPDSGTVIIMLSAKTKEQNIVDGLRAGSNDYMTKPFGRQELLARIDAHLLYHGILRRGTANAAKAVEFEDEVRGLEGTPVSGAGRRSASPSMARAAFNTYSSTNSIITPSAILTRNDSLTLPIGLMPDLPNALKQVEDGPFQVDFDSVVIISVSVVNLDSVLETHSLADVLVGLSALHVCAQDLAHKFHAYMEVKPYGDGFNMYLGIDTVGKPRDVAAAAMELASQLLEAAEDVHAKQHMLMELRIGGHIGGISGLVVDYSHPVMQCCGEAVHHALALKDTCPPGCVHLSKALVDHAKGSLAHCVPASEDTWLMRVGPWQEQLSKVQQEWDLRKIDRSHSIYNTQCLAAQPLQIALCWAAAAKSLQVWETATKVNSKGRRLKELEELRRVKLLLEAQLAEVSQDCDRLQDVVSSLTQRLDETNRCNAGLARSTLSSLETQAATAYATLERELESSYVIREEHLQNMVKQAQDEVKSLAEMHAKKEQGLRAAMEQETEKLQAANVRLFELEADIAIIQTELKKSKQELDKYKNQLQESEQEVEESKATLETLEKELGRTKEELGKANEELGKIKDELEGAREELLKSKAALECAVGKIREELGQVKLVVMEQNGQAAQRPHSGGHLQHLQHVAPSPTPATPHTPWKIPAAASESTVSPAPCSPQAPELPNSAIHMYHSPHKLASSALLQHMGGFTLDSFLESAGLGDLAPLFGREGITLPMLPWLSDDMLRSLGVLKLGNRMKLHAALNCLLLNGGAFSPVISGDC